MNTGILSVAARASYQAGFVDALAERDSPAWLRAAREQAFDAFLGQGWPHAKQEDWRFTDVRPLVEEVAVMPSGRAPLTVDFDERLRELGRTLGHRMRFLDGRHDPSASNLVPAPAGVRLAPLASVLGSSALERVLGRGPQSPDAFAMLNTAFFEDGAFVEIPAGLNVDVPIVLVYLAGAEGGASFPRTVVLARAGSRATIVEVHLGADGRTTLSNAVTEIVVEPAARLGYHTINRPSERGFHVGHLAVTQHQGSSLSAQSLVLGGRLVRNDVRVVLADEQCDCRLDGLYLADGDAHVDNQTGIEHRAPRCKSHESYRGAVAGRAQAVWSGKAVVQPGAQGTDARQVNRNVVLSDGAVVHAKPHLEIFANEVKCSHGATTGRLDADALFYLRSRGIGSDEARGILLAGFLRDGLAAVAEAGLRGELEAVVADAAHGVAREGVAP